MNRKTGNIKTWNPYESDDEESRKWEQKLLRLIMVPRTRKELAGKLREAGCPEEEAEDLLERFSELGLIDDRAYAVLYADSKSDCGVRRLRDELRFRGVSGNDIEDALEEAQVDEVARARTLILRWVPLSSMTLQKLKSRLDRKGFSGASVRDALDELRYEEEDARVERLFEEDRRKRNEYDVW